MRNTQKIARDLNPALSETPCPSPTVIRAQFATAAWPNGARRPRIPPRRGQRLRKLVNLHDPCLIAGSSLGALVREIGWTAGRSGRRGAPRAGPVKRSDGDLPWQWLQCFLKCFFSFNKPVHIILNFI